MVVLTHPNQLHGVTTLTQTLNPAGDGQSDTVNLWRVGFSDQANAQPAMKQRRGRFDSHGPDFPERRQQGDDRWMKE